jgi:hypothetical protein
MGFADVHVHGSEDLGESILSAAGSLAAVASIQVDVRQSASEESGTGGTADGSGFGVAFTTFAQHSSTNLAVLEEQITDPSIGSRATDKLVWTFDSIGSCPIAAGAATKDEQGRQE